MEKKKPAQVFHFNLYGKREDKYDFLSNNAMETITWQTLQPQAPELFFVPKDFEVKGEYDEGFSMNELFPLNNVGIVTAKDAILINEKKESLLTTVENFYSIETKEDFIKKIFYRPFDNRFVYYDTKLIERSREKVMQHFTKEENSGITLCKQFKSGDTYQHVFITDKIIESSFVSNKTSEITSVFPLYLYPETTTQQSLLKEVVRTPNLNMEIVNEIAKGLGLEFVPDHNFCHAELVSASQETLKQVQGDKPVFTPLDILDYIYAVLHSPSYREKYKEFLKIDFPKVPYPSPLTPKGGIEETQEKFWKLVALGSALRQIHLLESPVVEQYITGYPEDGDNVVIKPHFVISTQEKSHKESDTKCDASLRQHNKTGRVYINSTQYFNNVPEVAWNFYIGGYQPAQKWLKDRKDRELGFEDILHYQKIIVALSETDRIMKEIDKIEI